MKFSDIMIGEDFRFENPVEYSVGKVFTKTAPRQYVERGTKAPVHKVGTSAVRVSVIAGGWASENPKEKRLIHWSGAQPGQCPRKDSGVDKELTKYDTSAGPGTGIIERSAESRFIGNITCPVCRKLYRAAGRNPKRLTILDVANQLRKVGISMGKRGDEFRVNLKGGLEDTAYYTGDLQDALDTGMHMARSWKKPMKENPAGGAYVEEEHPDTEGIDQTPPLYKLNYITCIHGGKKLRRYPAFPVQVLPSEDSTIELRFWGSAKYDVHFAFPGFHQRETIVACVNYQILYGHGAHHLVHDFEKAKVCLALDGFHADRVIMKRYKELDGFPKLPFDWYYFQFIN